ncbi:MAG: aminopeptidase [Gemmatimonadaceae bacterium]
MYQHQQGCPPQGGDRERAPGRRFLRRSARALLPVCLTTLPLPAQPPRTSAPDWERIAQAIVWRIAPQPGERVLLVAAASSSPADSLIAFIRRAVRAAGGEDLGAVAVSGNPPADWSTPFSARIPALNQDSLLSYLLSVDVGIMLPGAAPTHPPYAAIQRLLSSAGGQRRTIHFHWAGAYGMSGEILPVTLERGSLYQQALLDTDYARLGLRQRAFENAMRGATVRVTTAAGTDLRFSIGDRPVTRQDGDASAGRAGRAQNLIDREVELPAGAIRVAPVETTVNGTIAFPDGDWGGERVSGLVMRFERGRVVAFEARIGRAGVEREFAAAGDAGRSFREFALGFNPLLAIPAEGERWVPYYGYGAGVVRLSLGDNTELGGVVSGGYVRWNFFTDATVAVNGDMWVRAGRMVKE